MTDAHRLRRRQFELAIDAYVWRSFANRTSVRVKELATMLRTRRGQLSRIVIQFVGTPAVDLLRERQLAEACRLLRSTPLSMAAIAEASGFGDRATSFRAFKARFGLTPEAYRSVADGGPARSVVGKLSEVERRALTIRYGEACENQMRL